MEILISFFIVLITLTLLLTVVFVLYYIYECIIFMYLRLRGYYLKRKYLKLFKPTNKEK